MSDYESAAKAACEEWGVVRGELLDTSIQYREHVAARRQVIRALHEGGWTTSAIAKQMGVGLYTVHKAFNNHE